MCDGLLIVASNARDTLDLQVGCRGGVAIQGSTRLNGLTVTFA